jgi:hypothetical protein
MATGDLNSDGKPDIVIANFFDNNISIFFNTGIGTFTSPITHSTLMNGTVFVITVDSDGTGRRDVIKVANVFGKNILRLKYDGRGSFTLQTEILGIFSPGSMVAAHFTSQSKLDTIIVQDDGQNVNLNGRLQYYIG